MYAGGPRIDRGLGDKHSAAAKAIHRCQVNCLRALATSSNFQYPPQKNVRLMRLRLFRRMPTPGPGRRLLPPTCLYPMQQIFGVMPVA
jgi:hypothetical protein